MVPPPMEEPASTAAIAVLTNDCLLRFILKRLSPADLVRAALACRRWRRASSLALPRAPPLLGCYFNPDDTPAAPPMVRAERKAYHPASFIPIDASSPRFSLDASSGFYIADVHLGLVLFLPYERPENLIPRILVIDPASQRHALIPPLPTDTDSWLFTRHIIGVAVLSRAHPSRLCFKAVCVTLDDNRPRAWVLSFRDGDCTWRVFPRSMAVKVDLHPDCSKYGRGVRTAGNIYWCISNSAPLLALDLHSLEFSFLLAPADQRDRFNIGEATVKLLYYDDLTPYDYEPPFFKCCADNGGADLNFVRDLVSLSVDDIPSMPTSCTANEVISSNSDSDIPEGYFLCTTKKTVTFYFDSGASRHVCCDEKLIKNLKDVPKREKITVYLANGIRCLLDRAGEISPGEIKLSPVFYAPMISCNVISIGQLDDGNNLIYIGENRVRVIDVKKGIMIGEGFLHHSNNEYIARNIICMQSAVKRKKRGPADDDVATQQSEEGTYTLTWILDSLCDRHMTGLKNILYDRKPQSRAFMTPKDEIKATHIGSVRTNDITLSNVFYCPGLRHNLISEGQLDREGFSCTRYQHTCKIQCRKTQEIVGQANQDENMLYYVNYFHPTRDPSLKHERGEGQSSSSSKKRTFKEISL